MKDWKYIKNLFSIVILMGLAVLVSSCVADQSVSKRRGTVKDYSVSSGSGCGSKYLKYVSPYDTCTTACAAATSTEGGYHLATASELTSIKSELTLASNTTLLSIINGSAGLCVADVVDNSRPTNAIEINADFCSCLNGKSDIVNNCDTFCANKAVTDQPILYVNTTPGLSISGNTKLGNLHNWCTVQLANDGTSPGCVLNATDEYNNTVNLAVTTTAGSNSFTANVQSLTKNRTWILKLIENKTGSNAQSKSFQIHRQDPADDSTVNGALEIAPISQYSCFLYGYSVTTSGSTSVYNREAYARRFYYYTATEMPSAMPPLTTGIPATTVCHDEITNPGNDSITYNRLELIPGSFSVWDKNDSRFVLSTNNKPKINEIIQTRLANEYNVTSTMDLFKTFYSMTSPNSTSSGVFLGYIMVPFKNTSTGKTYCPTSTEYNGTDPLLQILGDYMDDTEGLYIAEKEAEVITRNGSSETIYGTMLTRQSVLMNYGFYVENGVKIRINSTTLHTKTVYFYWPTTTTADALLQGTRRLFTVKSYNSLQGGSTTAPSTSEATTDKRIGCIPKTN